MIWLTSDTHFWHANIIEYCNRPFNNAQEMTDILIDNWNSCVGPSDIIYHLGDVVLARKGLLNETIARLNGHKILIRGNHDRDVTDNRFKAAGFEEVYKNPLALPEYGIVLSHDPIVSESGLFNVHGHTHNTDPRPKYLFYDEKTHKCISVELTDYKPVSLESILEEIRNGKSEKQDYRGTKWDTGGS